MKTPAQKPTDENINIAIDTAAEKKKFVNVPVLCKKADLTIANQDDYNLATEVVKEIKTVYKELDTQRKSITNPLDVAKKNVMELYRTPLELLDKAESLVKKKMIGYTDEQERIARENQRKLQEAADKQAEEDRKKIEAKIERAEASGKTDKVEALKEQLENVAPVDVPVITPTIEVPKGVSYRDKWTAEVVDFKALPDDYKIADQSKLDKVAQATKGSIQIPGVKFKSEKITSIRS